MNEHVSKRIYKGTELKFFLDIQCAGFSMAEDDFKVIVKGKERVEIEKKDMALTGEGKYLFTVDTGILGSGEYWLTVIAYVPDEDFDDGIRTEVQKIQLCKVTL